MTNTWKVRYRTNRWAGFTQTGRKSSKTLPSKCPRCGESPTSNRSIMVKFGKLYCGKCRLIWSYTHSTKLPISMAKPE